MNDLGMRIVDFLLKQMLPDEKWLERTPDGFRWAYSQFGQEVRIEEVRHPDNPEETGVIVNISAPMLEDVENTLANKRIINDFIGYNTSMCTPVFDEKNGIFFLNLRAPVQDDVVEWMEKLLSVTMVMQQHEVLKNVEHLAQMTHSKPAYYSHPKSGVRTDVDEILKVYSDLIVPFGRMPSMCTSDEITKLASTKLQEYPFVLTTYADFGVTTELPQGINTSLLEFNTEEPHPDYGNGLNVKHSFYPIKEEYKGLNYVAYHNRQLAVSVRSCGFGSFVYRGGFLVYRMFVPNLAYVRGLLWYLCVSAIVKARGMNRFLGLPEWNPDSVEKCLVAKMNAILSLSEGKNN